MASLDLGAGNARILYQNHAVLKMRFILQYNSNIFDLLREEKMYNGPCWNILTLHIRNVYLRNVHTLDILLAYVNGVTENSAFFGGLWGRAFRASWASRASGAFKLKALINRFF